MSEKKIIQVEAYDFRVSERRRYGGQHGTTFTWMEVYLNGEWISLGDPWPCINPKRSELVSTADAVRESAQEAKT